MSKPNDNPQEDEQAVLDVLSETEWKSEKDVLEELNYDPEADNFLPLMNTLWRLHKMGLIEVGGFHGRLFRKVKGE